MTNNDQIIDLTLREEQHRVRAARAGRTETITFHQGLAATFRRLVQEAQVQVEPVVDALASAPRYLNW